MQLKHVPNALCYFRLLMIPVLWYVALTQGPTVLFVVLLGLAFFSDQVDGWLCRKYDLGTPWGAKLDRTSDDLLIVNSVIWLAVLRWELFRDYWFVVGPLLLGLAISLGLQFARFKRKIPFHLYAGKATNWIIGLFAGYTFLFGPEPWTCAVLAVVAGYAILEEIILVSTRKEEELDEHLISMWVKRKPTTSPEPPERPADEPAPAADEQGTE